MAINSRIHILKYNTYFDRIYKKEENITAYDNYLLYDKANNPGIFNVDFKPNDGVSATQIINWTGDEPNYVVVTDIVQTENIVSRWFVMECTRIRGGQYQLTLRRDVVADNIDAISSSTAYIEKAIISDDNPLIYNQEEITTNQIKTKEIPLKDESGCAWIVGYIDRKYEGGKVELTSPEVVPDITVDDLEQWEYYKYTTVSLLRERCYGYIADESFDFEVRLQAGVAGQYTGYKVYKNWIGQDITSTATFLPATTFTAEYKNMSTFVQNKKDTINETVNQYKNLYYTTVTKPSDYNDIKELNGKFIYDKASQNYFKITVNYGTEDQSKPITEDKQSTYLYTWLRGQFADVHETGSGNASYRLNVSYAYATIQLQTITGTIATHVITMPSPANRLHCKDAPFDMFCIPFGDDIGISNSVNPLETPVTTNSTGYLALSQSLAQQLGSNLYDLQLLPFCPVTGLNYYKTNGKQYIDLNTGNSQRYTFATTAEYLNYMPLIWCTASSGTKTINIKTPLNFKNKKIENQCSFYRLVSPNYNGQFEFNLARNNINNLNSFNVDYTYIPYNPYIHINPEFSGLYGKDYNDARGLICQGDFSIGYLSNPWTNYQIQNKNYQNIFNRETQKLELDHSIDLKSSKIQAALGAITGGASGMGIGAITGGIPGAIAGAAIGGIASGIGGAADIAFGEQKYGEAMKYRKDNFNMQLDNIRALPNSIAKSTAFTANNKIFPIIEYYTCTDTEKNIVAKLIANTSMKVNSIGTLYDYIGNTWSYNDIQSRGFIKCQIIKLGNLSIDAHMQFTIFDEMEKGIYFGG